MKLSVALCTFNGEAHLAGQLESIARQSRLPDELVVVDDASTDGTREILEDFARRAPFPTMLHVGPQVGPARNVARAVARCTGDLIALSDQHDRWLPRRLASAEEAIGGPPRAVLTFSDAALVDGAGRPYRKRLWNTMGLGKRHLEAVADDPLAAMLRRPIVTGCTMTFHRSVLDVGLPFPPTHTLSHDWWLARCAAGIGRVVPIAEPVVAYRIDPGRHTGLDDPRRTVRPRSRWHWSRLRGARHRGDGGLNDLHDEAALLRDRIERLYPSGADALDTLDQYLAFVELRERLPTSGSRLPVVMRHAVAGNYRRFASGWVGAGVDLVRR